MQFCWPFPAPGPGGELIAAPQCLATCFGGTKMDSGRDKPTPPLSVPFTAVWKFLDESLNVSKRKVTERTNWTKCPSQLPLASTATGTTLESCFHVKINIVFTKEIQAMVEFRVRACYN